MNLPKITGRIYKPFDWFGWLMSLSGLALMCKYGGVGWIFGTDKNWWTFALVLFISWEYIARVAFGRVYKFVYYDTIIHNMYEIESYDKTFFVCAFNEEELDLYMENMYPGMEFKILRETIVESFIQTDQHC